jgi:Mn2+/Fe2+ NRAMP family transporter
MKPKEPGYHPLTFAAFLLAFFVLIWPTQADIVYYFLRQGKVLEATLVVISCIAIVALPLLLAQRSTNRHPEKWQPRLLTPVTWIIIVLNALLNTVLLLSQT